MKQVFFWFLKRFYNLNTLQSNHVKSSTSLATTNFRNTIEIVDNKDSELSKYLTLLSYLLKSYNFSTSPFYPFTKNTSLNFISNNNQSFFINDFFETKDIFLSLNDNTLLTQDNLHMLFWLTTTSNNSNFKLNFLNYVATVTMFDIGIDRLSLASYQYQRRLFDNLIACSLTHNESLFSKDFRQLSSIL
jgi:hypothetical protein